MIPAAWLSIVIPVLFGLSSAAVAGLFIRRGSFQRTLTLMQQSVDGYEALGKMKDEQLRIAAEDGERTQKLLTDCLGRQHELERAAANLAIERGELTQRVAQLEAQLRQKGNQP